MSINLNCIAEVYEILVDVGVMCSSRKISIFMCSMKIHEISGAAITLRGNRVSPPGSVFPSKLWRRNVSQSSTAAPQ
jgi:hypothetical protein